jgi:hypothetical protein
MDSSERRRLPHLLGDHVGGDRPERAIDEARIADLEAAQQRAKQCRDDGICPAIDQPLQRVEIIVSIELRPWDYPDLCADRIH